MGYYYFQHQNSEQETLSAKTDFRMTISNIVFLARNSSLGFVDDAQSENIGEKWEYRS